MPDSIDEQVATWNRELPALDGVREQIVGRIVRVARHLSTEGASSAGSDGLAMWQFKTLLALRRHGPPYQSNPSSLAAALDLSRGAATARLNWLEDLGLIEREHEAGDRRRVAVSLTKDGHEALERVAERMDAKEASFFAALDAGDQRRLADLLRKVLHTIEELEGLT